ncbi:vesicular glutamate transporter 2 [Elysia marginata]|uniref:Vesicular glutamate transporter 2 n=1 Tax=Elysia marginata TaxID=1093978 RepID=A0AAV4HH01_9GAST|nr:vesicular glutamate transporter 2 [Elysia marginata]
MGQDERYVAVAMLCLCMMLLIAKISGHLSNHLDLAPRYAGFLYGITNLAATIPGVVAPVVASALTPGGTTEQWRIVFYVCTAVAFSGVLFYLVMADGELQTWAIPPEATQEVKVELDDQDLKVEISNVKDTSGHGTALLAGEEKFVAKTL